MRALALLLLLLGLPACVDAAAGPTQSQFISRATGWFAQVPADRVLCSLQAIGGVSLDLTFYLGPDVDSQAATVTLAPLAHRHQRFQQATGLQYASGQSAGGAAELERGPAIVDPRLTDDALASALATHTSFYFPLVVHRLAVQAGHLCDVDLSGVPITSDCIDVAGGSALEEALFWCGVAVEADPKWSN